MSLHLSRTSSIQILLLLAFAKTGLVSAGLETGILRGSVADGSGGVIERAAVTIVGDGVIRETETDAEGRFIAAALPSGTYVVRAVADGFSVSEKSGVQIVPGETTSVAFEISIRPAREEITVADDHLGGRLTTESAFTLRDERLEALPDGPGGLAAALRIMAPFAAPQGPKVQIDGFRGRRLPPKHVISEIRIKQNAFSAEYDQLGAGRIEIFTRPGSQRYAGEAFVSFSNDRLNSRNPFSTERIPFRSGILSGVFSGPLVREKASFFANFERHEKENNVFVNATILDADLNPQPHNSSILKPEEKNIFHTRVDYQAHPNRTLTGAYIRTVSGSENEGVGAFSLPTRAYETSSGDHTLQLTENWFLSPTLLNELRFEYFRSDLTQHGGNIEPTIQVQGAFTGGGSGLRNSRSSEDRWVLHDIISWTRGNHGVRIGGEVRGVQLADVTSSNLSGTFTFTGGLAPVLDQNGQPVVDAEGEIVFDSLTSLERYRRTLFLQSLGSSGARILELGGGPSQFSIAGGRLRTNVSQIKYGWFFQDDWKLRPNLTLSTGLRYEGQTNISSLDVAPRLAVAWAPGASSTRANTVIRAGAGAFFDRVSERLVLRTRRFNDANLREFMVSNPEILQIFPEVPSIELLEEFVVSSNTVTIADDLRTPYSVHASASIERRLPLNLLLSAGFTRTRTLHALRSRNINAPQPGEDGEIDESLRPFPGLGPVFQIESSGVFNQNQLTVSLVNRSWKTMSWYATYLLSRARSDTDGPDSFPADPFDLSTEYGPSSLDARHTFYLGSWINAPGNTTLTFLVMARSGLPFNITTGRDLNGDRLFTERPSLAEDLSRPSVVATRFGTFDLEPLRGESIIPRNFGKGPGFFSVNMRLAKRFSFGGPGGGGAAVSGERRIRLILSMDVENLFNRVNPGRPVGNLDSPLFGTSIAPAGAFGFANNFAGNRVIKAGIHVRY